MNAAAQKKGLGKGLAALMNDEAPPMAHAPRPVEMAGERAGGISMIALADLQPGKYQPRHNFDDAVLNELAASIEKNGILQPLVVRPVGDGNSFEIIAGERRFRAARIAQLKEVPAIIRDVSDTQALEMALVENIQRADLNPVEEAAGYARLMEEFDYTQEKLSKVVGKSRSHVANLLRLLELPVAIRALLEEGKLSAGHARALIGAENAEALAKKIVGEGLNVRQAEALVKGGDTSAPAKSGKVRAPKQAGKEAIKSDEVREIETMLAENLGLKVSINTRGSQSGDVAIGYENLSQLDEILRRLGGSAY